MTLDRITTGRFTTRKATSDGRAETIRRRAARAAKYGA